MNNIFISYQREDSEGFARGLFQSLAGCGALLVLIGKDWGDCTDAAGQRRLDDPRDFVRMEVTKALEQRVRVIPVLVKGAKMPASETLPEPLQPVTRWQALELRHERWNQDLDHLVSGLARELGLTRLDRPSESPPAPAPPSKKSPW